MISIRRDYEINGGQYRLLLEKRAEAGILQAANLPDTTIIDPAVDHEQLPTGPNRPLNYVLSFLWHHPALRLAFVVDALNTKIQTKKTFRHTSIPVVGVAPTRNMKATSWSTKTQIFSQ